MILKSKFRLNQSVRLIDSDYHGTVVGVSITMDLEGKMNKCLVVDLGIEGGFYDPTRRCYIRNIICHEDSLQDNSEEASYPRAFPVIESVM